MESNENYLVGSKATPQHPAKSLYGEAIALEEITLFELEALSPDDKLKHLRKQYINLSMIGRLTVYQQGEILVNIKRICKDAGQNFVEYVNENLGLSPKTVNNYMNVFYYCCGCPEIAMKIKDSILYQVCTDNFDNEIREYLFSSGILENITNDKCKRLLEKVKNEGIKAIENEVEEMDRGKLIYHQTEYTIGLAHSVQKTLGNLKANIERRGRKTNNGIIEFTEQIKSDQPEASEINLRLYNAIEQAMTTLDKALSESDDILKAFKNKVM